jgi:hypothetical protein
MVQGCHYKKLMNSEMYNNRYRYLKNRIIFQVCLSLVGISDSLLLALILFIAGTM